MKDNEKLAYMAGFIDGEGCIRASGNYLNLSMHVSNTVKAPLLFMQEVFGGSVRGYGSPKKLPSGKMNKRAYLWVICGESAAKALLALLPYLIVKKQEAILGIALTITEGHERVDTAVKLKIAKL